MSERVPAALVTLFTRQVAIMLASGVPLLQALETLSFQPEHAGFGQALRHICQRLSSGHTFSECLRLYPQIFSRVYVTMIQAGEATGRLERSLSRLADWLERDERIRRKILSSLSYPAFVLVLCSLLAMIIIYSVLPTFVTIFKAMNTPLPLLTRLMILLTDCMRSPLVWALLLLAWAAGVQRFRLLIANTQGAALVYRALQRVPVVGSILMHGTCARYCAAASPLLGSGMPLTRALRLAAPASGNPVIDLDAEALVTSVTNGSSPSEHMARRPEIYSRSLCHMLSVGEETSRSADMFDAAGRYHQVEMEAAVDLLGATLEPVLLLVVSIAVALMLLAIFLPLYGSLSQLT